MFTSITLDTDPIPLGLYLSSAARDFASQYIPESVSLDELDETINLAKIHGLPVNWGMVEHVRTWLKFIESKNFVEAELYSMQHIPFQFCLKAIILGLCSEELTMSHFHDISGHKLAPDVDLEFLSSLSDDYFLILGTAEDDTYTIGDWKPGKTVKLVTYTVDVTGENLAALLEFIPTHIGNQYTVTFNVDSLECTKFNLMFKPIDTRYVIIPGDDYLDSELGVKNAAFVRGLIRGH